MATNVYPAVPSELSADEAAVLAQRHVKKHHVAIVLLHWFNAVVWLYELATGSALVVGPAFRFMPQWYLAAMQGLFGTRANLLRVHIAVGLTWTIVFAVYAVFGWRDYLHTEVLRKEIGLDTDDFRWQNTGPRSLRPAVANLQSIRQPDPARTARSSLRARLVRLAVTGEIGYQQSESVAAPCRASYRGRNPHTTRREATALLPGHAAGEECLQDHPRRTAHADQQPPFADRLNLRLNLASRFRQSCNGLWKSLFRTMSDMPASNTYTRFADCTRIGH